MTDAMDVHRHMMDAIAHIVRAMTYIEEYIDGDIDIREAWDALGRAHSLAATAAMRYNPEKYVKTRPNPPQDRV